MPILCAAVGCSSLMCTSTENNQKLSFHRFPKELELKQKWVTNMRRDGWSPSANTRLCSLHFDPSCFREGYKRPMLHSYAVPTIFPTVAPSSQKKVPKKRRLIMKTESDCQDDKKPLRKMVKMFTQSGAVPVSSRNPCSAVIMKQLERYKLLAEKRGLQLKALRRKCSRVTKKLKDLEALLKEEEEKCIYILNIG